MTGRFPGQSTINVLKPNESLRLLPGTRATAAVRARGALRWGGALFHFARVR